MNVLLFLALLFGVPTAPTAGPTAVAEPFVTAINERSNEAETIVIKTSAVCGMCKQRIERTLLSLAGVEAAELDLDTKEVRIEYLPEQITPAVLRQAIASVGYAADEVPARPKAVEALPLCCKPDSKACTPDHGGKE